MHLTPAQLKRFTRLFYSLLVFANDKYDVLGEPFAPWEDYGADQIADLSQFVFEDHREVISQYVAENPDELADSALEQIEQWDKAAFADAFFVVEVSKECTMLIGDELLFNVTGLDCEAAVDLGQAGDAIFTVLLPFEDRIVYGVVATPIPDSFNDIRAQVAADALAMLAEGLVASTAADLLQVGPGCVARSAGRRRLEREIFGDSFNDLDNFIGGALGGANTRTANGAALAPGVHVGALAGLSDDEREAAIGTHISEGLPHVSRTLNYLDDYGYRYIPSAPLFTLAETFMACKKEELTEIARHLGVRGYSKINKSELAKVLVDEMATPQESPAILSYLSERDDTFDLAKRAMQAGGAVSEPAAENANRPKAERWRSCLPYMNVFVHNDEVTCVIPEEIRTLLAGLDWEAEARRRTYRRHAHHLANTYVEMCGIAPVDELAAIYARYYPGEMSRREFEQFVFDCDTGDGGAFDIWTWKRQPYVVHFDFVGPDEISYSEEVADIDGDAFGNKPTEIEGLRRKLARQHEGIATWEVPSKTATELEAFDWDRSVCARPSVKAIQAFLDAHVPNGADDYFFADRLIEDLRSMVNFGAGPEVLVSHMQSQGLTLSTQAESGQLLVLLSLFVSDVPRWENNGWSAKELEEQKGKRG